MTADLDRALRLAQLALRFGRVERVTFHEDGKRAETDTDHTVMLALVACEFASSCGFDSLGVGRVAVYAVVHDLVEAYAGDVQTLTIDAAGRAAKAEREAAALARLRDEFAGTWLIGRLDAYERQNDPEARFVRVLDKMMPKLTHILNGCVAAQSLTDREGFIAAHRAQAAKLEAEYDDVPEAVHKLLVEAMRESEAAWL